MQEPRRRSDAALARLAALHPKSIDLSLDRIARLLKRLGDPQDKLPPVIHIAGTNGKGSTLAFLDAMLTAAGYRVHAYTSPHLIRFHERIRLAGAEIGEEMLTGLLEECERVNGGAEITFFEITTCAAFLAFARTPADAVLLETGLGGRLDTTNMVRRPALTAITPVSRDHERFLGSDLAGIAAEKAGILKPGAPCVVARQPAAAAAAIAARAAEVGVPLYRQDADWSAHPTRRGFRFEGRRRTLDLPAPSLFGPHQIGNAGTAVACAESLTGFRLDAAAIRAGIARARWPARLQRLDGRAWRLAPPWELWLDGGHNAAAAEALAGLAAGLWADRPLDLVFGHMAGRDPAAFLRPLAPHLRRVRTVDIPNEPHAIPAVPAAAAARAVGIDADTAPDVGAAIRALAAAGGDAPGRVLICGSLYLAGAVLKAGQ